MAKMRSVQVSRAKGSFELVEREIPDPRAGAVRIRVQACGICHSDSYTQKGTFPELMKLGGAKVILATATSGKAMAAALGGLGIDGKMIIVGAAARSWAGRPVDRLIPRIRSASARSPACGP